MTSKLASISAVPMEPPLEWQVHLARRAPRRACVVIAAILGTGLAAWLHFHSLLSAALAAGMLLAATGEFLLPIHYRLSPVGAEARSLFTWRRISWEEVRQVYHGPGEVKLSPLTRSSAREAFRGVLLRCEGNQPAVRAAVERYRHAAAGK